MNRLELVKRLDSQQSAVFTRQQFTSLIGKFPDYASVKLSRLVKDKTFVRIMQGRYCLPNSNPLCVASGLSFPSYVSLWSALEHHGATTQMPRIIEVVNTAYSGKLHLELECGSYELSLIKTKPSWIFGMEKEMLEGKTALIADKERTIIDGLLFSGRVPIDEVFHAISTGVQKNKLIDYGKNIGKQSLMKRLGYLMSSAGLRCEPPDFGSLTGTYVPLDTLNPRRGRYDSIWHVIVNSVIE